MKRDKGALAGVLVGLALGMGSVGCLITGFSLEARWDMGSVLLFCLGFSVVTAACLWRKKGGYWLLALLALLGGYLAQNGSLVRQLQDLLFTVSEFYNRAYGLGVFRWHGAKGDLTLACGIWAGLTAMLAVWAMMRKKSVFPALLLGLLPLAGCLVVTDTVPAAVPLGTLLGGALLLVLSRIPGGVGQGSRLALLLVLPVAAGLAALFLAVPQEGYQGQEQAQLLQNTILNAAQNLWSKLSNGEAGVGEPARREVVNLQGIGPSQQLYFRVMEVTADHSGPMYLRSRDFSFFDGLCWKSAPLRSEQGLLCTEAAEGLLVPGGEVTVRTVGTWDDLLTPYYPEERLPYIGGHVKNESGERTYTIPRATLREDWQVRHFGERLVTDTDTVFVFRTAEALPPKEIAPTYTILPEEVKLWAQEVVAPFSDFSIYWNTAERAEAIAEFVRNSAEYDLNTLRMPSDRENFAQWFLEESGTGYCVHFATAAAVLLRAAGIPARYVEGYLVEAKAGEPVAVTSKSAHAWVEYYVPEVGWIPLEATPGTGSEASQGAHTSEPPTQATQPPTQPSTEPQATQSPKAPEKTPPAATEKAQSTWLPAILWSGAGLLAAIPVQYGLRRCLRRHKRKNPNRQALSLWREAQRLARSLRETPPEEVENLALRAKFSSHTITSQELEEMEAYLKQARQRLLEKPWPLRLWHRLIRANL